MRQLISRVPHLIALLILCYVVLSLIPPSVWIENLGKSAMVLVVIFVASFVYFRWFRKGMHVLGSWPTPASNTWIRRYLLLLDFAPRTARTPSEVVVSLLIPCLTGLLCSLVVGTVAIARSDSEESRNSAMGLSLMILLGSVALSPVVHGLVFRLRSRYDLRSALLSLVMYVPTFIFVLTVLLHFSLFIGENDREFLSFSWFWIAATSYCGVMMCVLMVVLHRVGIDPKPAPEIVAHPLYRKAELATFMVSLSGLVAIVVLAS